ncbi:hypothetical protein EDB19DRAFT_1918331 [Suillus lakei]|nr:hypothetical protein EDB19DRAFT_1918331 [Suillus lakei]
MTDTFNIINSSKNLTLTSASALSRLHWLDLTCDGTDTLTFTLNIEAHIWLAHWQRESGTFRRPPVVALNLTRSKNLIHGDFRKLTDDEVDNAVDLIKDIFVEQIVVPTCKKAFNKDWKNLPDVSSSNARCGWIIEENNMFQQGSHVLVAFELPVGPLHSSTSQRPPHSAPTTINQTQSASTVAPIQTDRASRPHHQPSQLSQHSNRLN